MKRILLKLSGEALAAENGTGFDLSKVQKVTAQIAKLHEDGLEIAIVIGGGNFWRGRTGTEIDRTKSDQIGMLATVMNSIYVSDVLRSTGIITSVLTPFECGSFTKLYSKDRANKYFSKGIVPFFAGGTGHPYFSTDTGAVLRAIEIEADALLLAKAIDGVYSSDPKSDPSAVRYDRISLSEVLEKNLKVVDLTATILARENHLAMRIFALEEENSILNAASGTFNGTVVSAD